MTLELLSLQGRLYHQTKCQVAGHHLTTLLHMGLRRRAGALVQRLIPCSICPRSFMSSQGKDTSRHSDRRVDQCLVRPRHCSSACLCPILCGISCSEYVERYLECSFYNHAALTPGDWSTYCQLASLAHERLGLHVPAPALPEHQLSEGVPSCLQTPL